MQAPIRIAVFQPFFTQGASLDYRLLGLQHWLADRFSDVAQLEGASMLTTSPPGTERELVNAEPPDDEHIREILGALQARYALLSSFAVLGDTPRVSSKKSRPRSSERCSSQLALRDCLDPPSSMHAFSRFACFDPRS